MAIAYEATGVTYDRLINGIQCVLELAMPTTRKLWSLRWRKRYRAGRVRLRGTPISYVDGPSLASAYEAIVRHRTLEFDAGHDHPRILDVGANIGVATMYWRRRYPDAHITAFEPDPAIFKVLESNLQCWEPELQTELVQAAVWSHEGTVAFIQEGADAGRVEEGDSETVSVPAVSLRGFLEEPIDLLKIDVEGAELEIIRDCADSLNSVRRVFVEHHSFAGRDQGLNELLDILVDAGFRLHVQCEWCAPQPFLERKCMNGMDLQLNVFGFRPK